MIIFNIEDHISMSLLLVRILPCSTLCIINNSMIRVRGIHERSKKSLGVIPGVCAGWANCCCSLSPATHPLGEIPQLLFLTISVIAPRGRRVDISSSVLLGTSFSSPTHWWSSRIRARPRKRNSDRKKNIIFPNVPRWARVSGGL